MPMMRPTSLERSSARTTERPMSPVGPVIATVRRLWLRLTPSAEERIGKLRSVRVLTVVHQRDAGPGVFADAVRARGAALDTWFPAETGAPPADPAGYDAVMVFGGAMHADHEDRHPWLRDVKAQLRDLLEREVPVLGVCLGRAAAGRGGGRARRAARASRRSAGTRWR